MSRTCAYVWVSTAGQNAENQIRKIGTPGFEQAGCTQGPRQFIAKPYEQHPTIGDVSDAPDGSRGVNRLQLQ